MHKFRVWFYDKFDRESWCRYYHAYNQDDAEQSAYNDLMRGESVESIDDLGPDPTYD
jgi:DNA-binding SARP family transcriptional activator